MYFFVKMSQIKKSTNSVSDEFKWDEKKIVDMFLCDNPSFKADENFKKKLDSKISDKIRYTSEQRQDAETLSSIPRRLKWRMYLTGYGYAVCSFVALFLIWFCTNIFTWTIKLPTKYTYLDENSAFWNLVAWKQLVYNYNEDVPSNFSYDSSDVDNSLFDDIDVEEASVFDSSTKTLSKSNSAVMTEAKWVSNVVDDFSDSDVGEWWYGLFNTFMYDKTYRFSYKSKLFPKLDEYYPIYKVDWTLVSYSTPKQLFKNLKIWWISLKNFSDLEMMRFEMSEKTENWYTIIFDNRTQKLSFYPNESWNASDFQWTLPSKKKIVKAVEKELKSMWISLKEYWDWEVNVDDFDENMWIVQVFYPFKLQWKYVRNADENKQIWMDIAYDLNLWKIVYVNNIDIAKYKASDYQTLEKSDLESKIEQWWSYFSQWALHEYSTLVMLDSMEIIYLEKVSNIWDIYYVPAIKWVISTSLENYNWPKIIFQEIVQ